MHLTFADAIAAEVNTVNIFTPGDGDLLTFPETGFAIRDCFVNGQRMNVATYIGATGIDTRLPLVADYHGAMINVSFQSVDADAGVVACYAPVFSGTEYRLAQPVTDYAAAFARALPADGQTIVFACNCILNYLYGELEGKQIGLKAPITFGEIAYGLVNQTLVYVTLVQH